MAKERIFTGNIPDGAVAVADMDGFTLFNVVRYTNQNYLGFKLVANKPMANKANYWISFLREKKILVGGRDRMTLVEHKPELAQAVLEEIVKFEEGLDDD